MTRRSQSGPPRTPPSLRIARTRNLGIFLCAVDLKPESRHTLEFAIELAGDAEATVEVVHAAPEGEVNPLNAESQLQEMLVETARGQAGENPGRSRTATKSR